MNLMKFDRIISVNSETQGHEAKHLLQPNVDISKSWLCAKGSERGVVILKMERATVINKVHIGNANSAFVEILVGCASDTSDVFQTLIPTSMFMTPNESKMGSNKNQVRFFTTPEFDQGAVRKQWDLIKIMCSQPFDKNVPYGLCFVKIHGEITPSLQLKPPPETTIAVGSFFRKRKEESSEGQKILSISEKIRDAEKPNSLAKHTPLSTSKLTAQVKAKHSSKKDRSDRSDDIDESDNRKNRDFGLDEPSPKKIRKDSSESGETSSEKRVKLIEKERKEKETEKKARQREEEKKPQRAEEKDKQDAQKKESDESKRKKENLNQKDSKESCYRKEKGTPRPHRKRKPFHRLLEDVVFVLSGYQNPERANYRSHALAMGAKYSQDWNDRCTHLIASYINTPKCNQVKGKGKIVTKDWTEKCYSDKKRYPWRRFALDKAEKRLPESEQEIDAEQDSPAHNRSQPSSPGHSSSNLATTPPKVADASYDAPTDDEADEASLIPSLPDFFHGHTFHVDDSIADKALLERYIIAYNGLTTENLVDGVNYFVTLQRGTVLKHLLKDAGDCKAVSPTWIQSVNCSQKFINVDNFIVE